MARDHRKTTLTTQRPETRRVRRTLQAGGFESFNVNFWNAALAQIGSGTNGFASTPEIPVTAQSARQSRSQQVQILQPPETIPYPAFTEHQPGPRRRIYGRAGRALRRLPPGLSLAATSDQNAMPDCGVARVHLAVRHRGWRRRLRRRTAAGNGVNSVLFGPYDLAHNGINSTQQLEDQWNLLYNYATVVGVDTPISTRQWARRQARPRASARRRCRGRSRWSPTTPRAKRRRR